MFFSIWTTHKVTFILWIMFAACKHEKNKVQTISILKIALRLRIRKLKTSQNKFCHMYSFIMSISSKGAGSIYNFFILQVFILWNKCKLRLTKRLLYCSIVLYSVFYNPMGSHLIDLTNTKCNFTLPSLIGYLLSFVTLETHFRFLSINTSQELTDSLTWLWWSQCTGEMLSGVLLNTLEAI